HAARFLSEQGAVLVGVADSQGTVSNPEGLDVAALIALKQAGKKVTDLAGAEVLDRDAVIGLACDIWIPAARPDVVHDENVQQLKTRLVAQGANIPFTAGAEKYLHEQGILCLPDFIANAGGVICAAKEYQGSSETAAFQAIAEKIQRNTKEVLAAAKKDNLLPREAAVQLARRRLEKAMGFRRWNLF
ncbi:MAG: Glu/Leu/Phe/Val dehydrogenase, partial [Candidatus Electrothrix sp. ATG2]|nr:Glu/Leu/Phe/Val dehydrogenase [Candidatus Electrothrix sp. ATG2]